MHKYIYALVLLAGVSIYLFVGLTNMKGQQQQWIDAGAIQHDPNTKELHFVPCS
jgi:hypothetical protein